MQQNNEPKSGIKRFWSGTTQRVDGFLDKLPLPGLTKRVLSWGLLFFLVLLVLNWIGLPTSFGDLLRYAVFALLVSGLGWPSAVARKLMEQPPAWARWPVQILSFLVLAVWVQTDTRLQGIAVGLILVLLLLWLIGYQRLGGVIKQWIPGHWDDPYIDRLMTRAARWTPRMVVALVVLLLLPLALITHKRTFVIRDADQQAGVEEYKIYTDYGATSAAAIGQTFRNVRDVRFWKYDTAGLQGALLSNKGKRVTVWTSGINWPARDIYENILWIAVVEEAK